MRLSKPVARALDVGCGTGQSSLALKEISDSVIGVDVSREMLALAQKEAGIEYRLADAADLSILETDSFDLITACMAYHWFDQDRFLAEAQRVLKDHGWLIIYNNGFTGQMKQSTSFVQWVEQSYVKRYPTPPRNAVPLTREIAGQHGFASFEEEQYQNDVQFTVEELAAYLMTQSNVIAAVEQGDEKIEAVFRWLVSQSKPYFISQKGTFTFSGSIWYLHKKSNGKNGC